MTTEVQRGELERQATLTAAAFEDLLTAAQHAADMVSAGRHARRKAGRSDTFWQFRDYAQGDPAASVDWRQSARLDQRLLVRQTEWEQPQKLLLWCGGGEDFDYAGPGRPSKRFRGQVLALAAGLLALRGGEQVGLWGSSEPARAGAQTLGSIAQGLLREDIPLAAPEPVPGATLLLVSDFHQPPEELKRAFAKAKTTRGTAVAVVVEDPDEEHFSYQGSTRFEGSRGQAAKTFGEASAVRSAYMQTRTAHHDALKSSVGGGDNRLYFHRTDDPLMPLLQEITGHISRGHE